MKSKIRIVLEFLVAFAIILFLLSKINVEDVAALLKVIDYRWIMLGIVVYIVSLLLTAYSLKALFNSVRIISFKEWLRYYLIGLSTGLVLPGRAGDLSVIYFLKDKGFDIGESTALTLVDKAITLAIFSMIAFLGLFTILSSKELIYGIIAAFVLLIGCLFLFTERGKNIVKKIIGRYAENFKGFSRTLKNLLKNHKEKIAINIIVTILRPIGNGLLIVFILKAMHYDVSLLYASLISSITLIASLTPLTPNGLGIREGVGTFLFSKLSIPLEASVSMYLIILLLNYTTGIIGLAYYLCKRKR